MTDKLFSVENKICIVTGGLGKRKAVPVRGGKVYDVGACRKVERQAVLSAHAGKGVCSGGGGNTAVGGNF